MFAQRTFAGVGSDQGSGIYREMYLPKYLST